MNEENNEKNKIEIKQVEEMIKYEKLTGKYAIWRGVITEGFKKWHADGCPEVQRRPKRYHGNTWIHAAVPTEIRNDWYEQAKTIGYSSFSRFQIDAIRYFIECISLDSNLVRKRLQEIDKEKIDVDILEIDDDLVTLEVIGKYFTSRGFSFKGVISANAGYDYLEFIKPRIILLDIILPDENGYDVFKKIRNKKGFKDIPIFFVSSTPKLCIEKEIKERNLDPVGIICVPFEIKELEPIIEILEI